MMQSFLKPLNFRVLLMCLLAAAAGCSIRKVAVNKLGNALASGGSTYESDDDPELVASAVPFGLKLMESLLAESPKHAGLLLAASSGFTEYAYAFVGQQADETRAENLDRSDAMRERARSAAKEAGLTNVDVRAGDAESLPVEDATTDVVISNGVLNLVPNKERAFAEIVRERQAASTRLASETNAESRTLRPFISIVMLGGSQPVRSRVPTFRSR